MGQMKRRNESKDEANIKWTEIRTKQNTMRMLTKKFHIRSQIARKIQIVNQTTKRNPKCLNLMLWCYDRIYKYNFLLTLNNYIFINYQKNEKFIYIELWLC